MVALDPATTGGRGESAAASHPFDPRVLEDFVEPFGGRVYCHAPSSVPFEVRRLARPDDGRDRWGAPGERTIYLAGDPAVALAEYARNREPGAPAEETRIVRLRLRAVSVLDLRRSSVAVAAGVPPAARHVGDREVARRVSRQVRTGVQCEGLLVPSMAFLDRTDRFNVVLFVERLGVELESILCDAEEVGRLRMDG